ncbi:MAG: hypothetical protein IJX07_06370 [Bacillales bacterium]|nr:hypothetical protein [Bacillales bacterium]
MPEYLLSDKTKTFTDYELVQEVNKRQTGYYANLAKAIYDVGIGVVVSNLCKGLPPQLALLVGAGVSSAAVIASISAEMIDNKRFSDAISRMKPGNRLSIRTRFYLWESGSGNHHAYITRNTYTVS